MNYVNIQESALRREALQADEQSEESVCSFCRLRSDQVGPFGVCPTIYQADKCRYALNEKDGARQFKRTRLHTLYRETLKDYREGGSPWMQNFTRKTLSNIWEEYRST